MSPSCINLLKHSKKKMHFGYRSEYPVAMDGILICAHLRGATEQPSANKVLCQGTLGWI